MDYPTTGNYVSSANGYATYPEGAPHHILEVEEVIMAMLIMVFLIVLNDDHLLEVLLVEPPR